LCFIHILELLNILKVEIKSIIFEYFIHEWVFAFFQSNLLSLTFEFFEVFFYLGLIQFN